MLRKRSKNRAVRFQKRSSIRSSFTILYLAICIAVTMAVPPEALAGSSAPLALVFTDAPEAMQISFTAIAVVATVNGVLIQMIMVSRIMYGMADRGRLPAGCASIDPHTNTLCCNRIRCHLHPRPKSVSTNCTPCRVDITNRSKRVRMCQFSSDCDQAPGHFCR
ncbi:MAG: APC family permease [Marivivens sp.]|nr:APC family permease [Marivivens sp.]